MSARSLDKLISEIESKDFYTNFMLFNSLDMLLKFFKSNETTKLLEEEIIINRDRVSILEDRIKKLWKLKTDTDYLHPFDHSIATYLYVIFKTHKEAVEPVLLFILKNQLKNLWWTYIVYNFINRNRPQETSSYKIRKISKLPKSLQEMSQERVKISSSETDKIKLF